MIEADIQSSGIARSLEKVAPRARVAQTAEDAGGEVIFIGNAMAEITGIGYRERPAGGLEEAFKNG